MVIPTRRPPWQDRRPPRPGPRAALAGRIGLLAAIVVAVVTASFTIAGFGPVIATAIAPGNAPPARSGVLAAPDAAPDAPARIDIDGYRFLPATLTVPPGTRITVRNAETATLDVAADDGSFSTGAIQPGTEVTIIAPSAPGRYPYHCTALPVVSGALVVR